MKEIVGEYGFVMKQFSHPSKSNLDKKYGEGAAEFIASAIEAFYQK